MFVDFSIRFLVLLLISSVESEREVVIPAFVLLEDNPFASHTFLSSPDLVCLEELKTRAFHTFVLLHLLFTLEYSIDDLRDLSFNISGEIQGTREMDFPESLEWEVSELRREPGRLRPPSRFEVSDGIKW